MLHKYTMPIEQVDISYNYQILRIINSVIAVMTTAFAHCPWEKHRVWYELLHGNRGLIIWDDKNEFVSKDGTLGDRGREVAPYYNEISSGLGALLINSTRLADPIAIHYSKASMRTEWMLLMSSAPRPLEISSGLGALLINSTRLADPIAIHYSQASMRTEWMLGSASRVLLM